MVEQSGPLSRSVTSVAATAVPLVDVDSSPHITAPTGVEQLDVVLGGGLVSGSVTLVGGEPGIGKSTLLVQASGSLASLGRTVLYVSAEESVAQVRERAARLGALVEGVFITDVIDVDSVTAEIDRLRPDVVIVDSVQTMYDPSVSGTAGSVTQVREAAHKFVRVARGANTSVVLVGHVTKEGNLAGPRVLEHVVDTVLTFEGDRHHALRFLRAVKHRFGSTRGLGVFEMCGQGLLSVDDPSRLFLIDRTVGAAGSVVTPVLDGNRPLLVEVQALTAETSANLPRRVVQGFDAKRLALLLAVLQRHCQIGFDKLDVFVSVVGGAKVNEPGADLAVAMAVASSVLALPVPSDMVICGEVGLAGEVRQVAEMDRRLAEAGRLGFDCLVVPSGSPAVPSGLRPFRTVSVADTLHKVWGHPAGANEANPSGEAAFLADVVRANAG